MSIYTTSASQPFLESIAQGMLQRFQDPETLCQATLILPHERHCHNIQELFLKFSHHPTLFLPKLRTLASLEESLFWGEYVESASLLSLPRPLSLNEQRLLLITLLRTHCPELSFTQATSLSMELNHFLSELYEYGITYEQFEQIIPEEFAGHWEHTLRFIRVILTYFPQHLNTLNACHATDYRYRIITLLIEIWHKNPPSHPLIIAGINGYTPLTQRLLTAIASLPEGHVIFPAFDQNSLQKEMQFTTSDHPFYLLQRFLTATNTLPDTLPSWAIPQEAPSPKTVEKQLLIHEMMRPACQTTYWHTLPQFQPETLQDYSLIHCTNLLEEAEIIAMLLRKSLEHPTQLAALITPNQRLLHYVTTYLQQWGISYDYKQEQSFESLPESQFLILSATMVLENFRPFDFLAALKHPYASGGMEAKEFRHSVSLCEIHLLRGVRFKAGLKSLLNECQHHPSLSLETQQTIETLLKNLQTITAPFEALCQQKTVPFKQLLQSHLHMAEALAATKEYTGTARLWYHERGQPLASFFIDILTAATEFGEVAPRDYLYILQTLYKGHHYTPSSETQARIKILTPSEAYLLHFDRVILAELNEGTWPEAPSTSPWLNNHMRKQIGLPLPEQSIGQMAFMFMQFLSLPHIYLTRAEKIQGSPTLPSRWIMRLQALLYATNSKIPTDQYWQNYRAKERQAIEKIAIAPPAPCPPLSLRPSRFSVTEIETLMRDPYSIYAKHILKLRPLSPLDANPANKEFGQFIHYALEMFIATQAYDQPLEQAYQALLNLGRQAFSAFADRPAIKAIWWPRFERIAQWFVKEEYRFRELHPLAQSWTEEKGSYVITATSLATTRDITLIAKADRIDLSQQGTWWISDYKTGLLPSKNDCWKGFSPQLPLEAWLLHRGGFFQLSPRQKILSSPDPYMLQWIRITGRTPIAETQIIACDHTLLEHTEKGLFALLQAFEDANTPYLASPLPAKAPAFSDYQHLERHEEWQ